MADNLPFACEEEQSAVAEVDGAGGVAAAWVGRGGGGGGGEGGGRGGGWWGEGGVAGDGGRAGAGRGAWGCVGEGGALAVVEVGGGLAQGVRSLVSASAEELLAPGRV